jgi:hypothetical protein
LDKTHGTTTYISLFLQRSNMTGMVIFPCRSEHIFLVQHVLQAHGRSKKDAPCLYPALTPQNQHHSIGQDSASQRRTRQYCTWYRSSRCVFDQRCAARRAAGSRCERIAHSTSSKVGESYVRNTEASVASSNDTNVTGRSSPRLPGGSHTNQIGPSNYSSVARVGPVSDEQPTLLVN